MDKFKITGGARVGYVNSSWPLATLTATPEMLEINAGISGKFVFFPGDIISLVPYSFFVRRGIKIIHNVEDYNEKIIFWTPKEPIVIIRQIYNLGFMDAAPLSENKRTELAQQYRSAADFPLKKQVSISYVLVWNFLIIMGIISSGMDYSSPLFKLFFGIAMGIVYLSALLLLVSPKFAKVILKEGREVSDFRSVLVFLLLTFSMLIFRVLTL